MDNILYLINLITNCSTSITTFYLLGSSIHAVKVVEKLASSTSITTVDISCNKLGGEHGVAVAQALASSTSITTVDISCNRLEGEYGVTVLDSLAASKLLTSIKIKIMSINPLQIAANDIADSNKAYLLDLANKLLGIGNIEHKADPELNQTMFNVRITVKEWELLKNCDREVLSTLFSGEELETLLDEIDHYFTKYALTLMRVCKAWEQEDTGTTGMINTYVVPCDDRADSYVKADNQHILGDNSNF